MSLGSEARPPAPAGKMRSGGASAAGWLAPGGREVEAPFVLTTWWRGRRGAACAGRHTEAEGAEKGRRRLAAKEGRE